MKLNKVLLKTLGLIALASPIVYAGECEELGEYFKDIEDVYIRECKENADGKITDLNIYETMNSMTDEYMDKILSYDTITTLYYHKNVEDEVLGLNLSVDEVPTNMDKLTNLKKLKNLKSLTIELVCNFYSGIGTASHCAFGNITENTLKDLTSLEYLKLIAIDVSQNNIDEISTLTNLESLLIIHSPLNKDIDYKILSKIENVKYLEIDDNYIPSELVNSITSVKELVLYDGYEEDVIIDDLPNVEKISWTMNHFDVSSLGKLDKFEELNLHFDHYEELSSLEKLKQIKKLTIAKDKPTRGTAGVFPENILIKFSEEHQLKELSISNIELSDSNVEEIMKLKNLEKLTLKELGINELSEEGANLLKSLESRCSMEVDYDGDYEIHGIKLKSFKNEPCNKSTTSNVNSSTIETLPTTTNVEKEVITSTTETISTTTITKTITKTTVIVEPTNSTPDKQALINDDKTIESDLEVEDKTNESDIEVDEKNIDKSVESEEEEPEGNVKISTNYKCGKADGKCPKGECCSKYGWCGKSDKHCLVSEGCQSEFGDCKDIKISTNDRCGKTDGKCPKGECCSKYGWCGKSDKHCLVSKGCQSEFGKCEEDIKISTNDRCGKADGKCPKGECCSKYGWCGKSDKHCLTSEGCQSEFGICK